MHLYRIIAEVCASARQRNCEKGQRGLATVWVRSETEEGALREARKIIDTRSYQSVGDLSVYLEHTHGLPSSSGEGDPLAAGYTSMKEKALSSGDGLFEIWFPPK